MLVPKVARFFNTTPSTNAALLAALDSSVELAEGTVYLTRAQPEGRGQAAKSWHSTPGANLTLSLLLRPDHLSPSLMFALNAFASLAVSTTLETLLPPHLSSLVRVKWPNDVYVGDRKIAGILIQNGLRGQHIHWSIVGIGLNVNEDNFPPELYETATSLKLLLGQDTPLDEVLALLFQEFTRWYQLTANDLIQELRTAYRQRLYRLNQQSLFLRTSDQTNFIGTIAGVSPGGLLQVRHEKGGNELFDLQQLRFLPPAPGSR